MLPVEKFSPTNTHDEKNKQFPQLLDGQSERRISGAECHRTRFDALNVGSLFEKCAMN